jgi:hypothetical protein
MPGIKSGLTCAQHMLSNDEHGSVAAGGAVWCAACPLWKKVKQSASVPHLSRWFDFMSSLPACTGAINSLCYKQKVAAAQEADRAAGKGGGGEYLASCSCCLAPICSQLPGMQHTEC